MFIICLFQCLSFVFLPANALENECLTTWTQGSTCSNQMPFQAYFACRCVKASTLKVSILLDSLCKQPMPNSSNLHTARSCPGS